MSQQTLNAFIAKVQTDNGLLDQMKVATDAAAAIAIAKTAGFEITAADLIRHQAAVVAELSDEDLEGVSGGQFGWNLLANSVPLAWATIIGSITVVAGGTVAGVYAAKLVD